MYFSPSHFFLLLTLQWVCWVDLFYASGIAFYSSCLSDYQLLQNHSQGPPTHESPRPKKVKQHTKKDTRKSLSPRVLGTIRYKKIYFTLGHPRVLGTDYGGTVDLLRDASYKDSQKGSQPPNGSTVPPKVGIIGSSIHIRRFPYPIRQESRLRVDPVPLSHPL